MKHQGKENLEQAIAAMRADQPDTETIKAASGRSAAREPGSFQRYRSWSGFHSWMQRRKNIAAAIPWRPIDARAGAPGGSPSHECVACRREAETGKRPPAALLPGNKSCRKSPMAVPLDGRSRGDSRSWDLHLLVQAKFFSGPSACGRRWKLSMACCIAWASTRTAAQDWRSVA